MSELDQGAIEDAQFQRLALFTVLQHRGACAWRVGSESLENPVRLERGEGGAVGLGDRQRFGQNALRPFPVERFFQNFEASPSQRSEWIRDAIVQHLAPGRSLIRRLTAHTNRSAGE